MCFSFQSSSHIVCASSVLYLITKDLNQARLPIHIKGWRASTLGRITPSVEMEELFWNLFSSSVAPEKHDDLVSLLDKNYTYIFELCGKQNKVVTMCVFSFRLSFFIFH